MNKSILCLALSIACVSLCTAGGVVYGANAEESEAVTPETSGFRMTAGASVRIADSAELCGIRWSVTMPSEEYEALESDSVSYGILIAPYDYYKKTPLTAESVFGKREISPFSILKRIRCLLPRKIRITCIFTVLS